MYYCVFSITVYYDRIASYRGAVIKKILYCILITFLLDIASTLSGKILSWQLISPDVLKIFRGLITYSKKYSILISQ